RTIPAGDVVQTERTAGREAAARNQLPVIHRQGIHAARQAIAEGMPRSTAQARDVAGGDTACRVEDSARNWFAVEADQRTHQTVCAEADVLPGRAIPAPYRVAQL